MKLGWSGFRSAFAFAIIAVTSAAEANSFGGGGGFWAVSCRAIAAVISRVRIVQRTRRRIRPPVRRRLYSIRISPARAPPLRDRRDRPTRWESDFPPHEVRGL